MTEPCAQYPPHWPELGSNGVSPTAPFQGILGRPWIPPIPKKDRKLFWSFADMTSGKKNGINKYLWWFVVDLRRAWIYRENNFSSRTKSFISRRLGEPPLAPAITKWDILWWGRRCVVVKKWGKPLKIQTKSVPFYHFNFRHFRGHYLKWTSKIGLSGFDEAISYLVSIFAT